MKTYYVSGDLKVNWIEAYNTCRSHDMHLLSLNTAEDYQEFKKLYIFNKHLFEKHTYIGGSKMNSHSWYWVNDGSPINTIAWGRGEPNGGDAKDYCTDIVLQGNDLVLNDLPCRAIQYIFRFICEKTEIAQSFESKW